MGIIFFGKQQKIANYYLIGGKFQWSCKNLVNTMRREMKRWMKRWKAKDEWMDEKKRKELIDRLIRKEDSVVRWRES